MANLILVFPRQSPRQCAGYLVYHPERRQLMPKLTLLDWRRLDGVCRFSVAVLRDHLYFLGGYVPAKKKYSRQVLRYELSSGTWYYCSKMRTPRADFQAFAFDGKIYCAGGRTTGGALTDLTESFEPVTNVWFQENPLPLPCAEFACLCLDQLSTVLLVGGVARSPNGSYRCFNHVWRFGLLKSSNPYLEYEYLWQPLPSGACVPTSLGVRGHQLVLDATFNRVYLVGGSHRLGAASNDGVVASGDRSQQQQQSKSRLPGLYYFSVDDLKALLEAIDKVDQQPKPQQQQQQQQHQQSAEGLTMYWTRRQLDQCSRLYAGVSLINNKLFIVGGTPVESRPVSGSSRKKEQDEAGAGAAADSQTPQTAVDEASVDASSSDVGYYDKRRKSYHSLFSLRHAGIDTSEVFSVTVKLEKSNKDLKQDRLDWLLQWSLW